MDLRLKLWCVHVPVSPCARLRGPGGGDGWRPGLAPLQPRHRGGGQREARPLVQELRREADLHAGRQR